MNPLRYDMFTLATVKNEGLGRIELTHSDEIPATNAVQVTTSMQIVGH